MNELKGEYIFDFYDVKEYIENEYAGAVVPVF